LKDPATGNYSIIIVTGAATSYTFNLSGGLSTGTLHVWSTNASNAFERGQDITPAGGSFTIACAANSIYSLTTTTGQSKGTHVIPPAAAFPFPYYENYESYGAGQTPRYHSDQKGTFEVAADADGKHLRQVLPAEGILWHTLDKPVTVFGDMGWKNYDLRAKVFIAAGNVELCARVGEVMHKRGYRLVLSKNGSWQLLADAGSLRSGTVSGFDGSAWHSVKLSLSGSAIAVSLDGKPLVSLTDATRGSGMAGFASSYDPNMFDDLIVEPVGANGTIPTTALRKDFRIRGAGNDGTFQDGGLIFRRGSDAQLRILRPDGKRLGPGNRSGGVPSDRFPER
jgi:galactosylceramidase